MCNIKGWLVDTYFFLNLVREKLNHYNKLFITLFPLKKTTHAYLITIPEANAIENITHVVDTIKMPFTMFGESKI